MNVMNRKLFANRDARRKLASMGGIVTSSPELITSVQSFRRGGRTISFGNTKLLLFDDGEMYADLQLNYRSSWLLEKLYRANPVFKESFTFVYTKTGLVRNMISDLYFTDDHLITH